MKDLRVVVKTERTKNGMEEGKRRHWHTEEKRCKFTRVAIGE
jgi:hypothetical protein